MDQDTVDRLFAKLDKLLDWAERCEARLIRIEAMLERVLDARSATGADDPPPDGEAVRDKRLLH